MLIVVDNHNHNLAIIFGCSEKLLAEMGYEFEVFVIFFFGGMQSEIFASI